MQTIELQTADRVTVYQASLFAWVKREIRDVKVYTECRAQWRNAVTVECSKKGARRRVRIAFSSPSVVMLLGWGHPSPPDNYSDPVIALTEDGGALVSRGTRYESCSPEWDNEFDRFLREYLATSRNQIWIDLRSYKFDDGK